jgi:hypothetical protein
MRPRLVYAYIAICVAALAVSVLVSRLGRVHEYFTLANILMAIFFSLDAFAWFLTRKYVSDDPLLNAIQTTRVVLVAVIMILVNYVAYTNPGPEGLLDWNFWIFLSFMGFFLAWALLMFELPRRDLLLLGHIVRTWKLGLPKLRAANQYWVLLTIIGLLELALLLSPIHFDLSEGADLLNFVILNGFSVILYCLVGPIFWIAFRASYTMGDNCFLSYSRIDGEHADAVRIGLQARGLGCFQDVEGVRAGDEISDALGEAIANSDVFIPILSEASMKSQWVRDEIFLALHYAKINGSPVVIPVRLCAIEAVDAWVAEGNHVAASIKSMNILDLGTSDGTRDGALDRLAETIKRKTKPGVRH